ncbi:MAG TPA: hypothetical protein PK593_03540 [Thermomicrobiales bacterium]|nr:hypothetical protein [Chloroflexota bacterium]HCG31033.1 hypothetical protein [Chloroflexota bacterium]HQX62516.1 hypothetical protein [Thermomicrobiales bacterium]HQZ89641.1 hypothetical protein [Thermomicrobiales bacterium]HRA30613.1 hypothetical protein [Thermomicrobiales bacterium]
MSTRFDPREHLRELDDGSYYLDIKWRMHWLRHEHPEADIQTELLALDDEHAICKATVSIPGGGSATSHASATRAGAAAFVETAETRAIGRALAALGYGAEYIETDQPRTRGAAPVSIVPAVTPAEQPVSQPQAPSRMRPVRQTEQPARPRSVQQGDETAEQEPPSSETPTPMMRGSDLRARDSAARGDPADVSWTHFWAWAKSHGYKDAQHLKDLLGIDVNALTPAEVRARVARYEDDHGRPDEADEE